MHEKKNYWLNKKNQFRVDLATTDVVSMDYILLKRNYFFFLIFCLTCCPHWPLIFLNIINLLRHFSLHEKKINIAEVSFCAFKMRSKLARSTREVTLFILLIIHILSHLRRMKIKFFLPLTCRGKVVGIWRLLDIIRSAKYQGFLEVRI